jgi:hypothetical protein
LNTPLQVKQLDSDSFLSPETSQRDISRGSEKVIFFKVKKKRILALAHIYSISYSEHSYCLVCSWKKIHVKKCALNLCSLPPISPLPQLIDILIVLMMCTLETLLWLMTIKDNTNCKGLHIHYICHIVILVLSLLSKCLPHDCKKVFLSVVCNIYVSCDHLNSSVSSPQQKHFYPNKFK